VRRAAKEVGEDVGTSRCANLENNKYWRKGAASGMWRAQSLLI
jgi:hypothetical protein